MLILIYLTFEAKKAQKSNYVFEADDETLKVLEQADQLEKDGKLPNVILAVLPIICVAVVLNVLKQDISVALLSGIVLCLILCYKNVTGLRELLADSVTSAAQTTINASAIVAIASVGLDSLPHSGGIVAVLAISGVSYKDGYKHLFVVTVVITLLALALGLVLGNILYPIAV